MPGLEVLQSILGVERGSGGAGPLGPLQGRWVWHPDRLSPLPLVSWRLEHPKKTKCSEGRLLREAASQNH